MEKVKEMTIGDLSLDLRKEMCRRVAEFSLVILAGKTVAGRVRFCFCGSGSFVKIANSFGILTAEHVVTSSAFLNGEYLGLSIVEFEHSPRIPLSDLKIFRTRRQKSRSEGPDLALIMLPADRVSFIREKKGFFDLEKCRLWLDDNPLKNSDGVWAVCGAPKELIDENQISAYSIEKIPEFKSLVMLSGPENSFECDRFDYLDIGVDYENSEDLPESFQGVSGGGLWQIPVGLDASGNLACGSPVLSGVAFYELPLEKTNRKIIRCHGRNSIYKLLLPVFEKTGSDSVRDEDLDSHWLSL